MATVMPKTANWFTYFPEDYRWSSAVGAILGSAPWGGSDLGEVDRVCRPLRKALGDDEAWFDAWCAEAERLATRAREADHDAIHWFTPVQGAASCSARHRAGRVRSCVSIRSAPDLATRQSVPASVVRHPTTRP